MNELAALRDAALLLDMRLAAGDAMQFVAGMDEAAFLASTLHQSAVIRMLEVLGEAANKISFERQAAHPDIPWREMIGMRNQLIHGYADIRLDVVWRVVQDRLPPLIAILLPLIPPNDDGIS